jgi:hypothetical protein
MSVLLSKLKKAEQKVYRPSNIPQACNPIYTIPQKLGCRYCTDKPGRKKIFSTLYKLHHHFRLQHSTEESYRETSMKIADLIIEGSLL